MRLALAATVALASLLATGGGDAQVASTGKRMPQPDATAPAGASAGTTAPAPRLTEAQQREAVLKVQRATEARDKAWDAKMKRTMSSICHGC